MDATGKVKILVIGGYGAFGSRFVELLKDEPRLKLIVAGRSRARAKTLCIMQAKAELVPAEFDRDGDAEAQIGWLKPDIIVDASGPFQSYGSDPYRVIRGALAHGADYLDLADSREFVTGVGEFNDAVTASKRFVLTGLSTFPALSGAVARALARDLASVEGIIAGIAPSPYSGLGRSVIDGVLSYAGKPVEIVRDGKPTTAPGLVDFRNYTITMPGRIAMFERKFCLIDVPDLDLMKKTWPQADEVWFGVGTAPTVMLRVLNTFATLVQRRFLPRLSFMAPLVHWAVSTVRWGEHRGGMFVRLYGRDANGGLCRRRWHMVAEGSNGPFVPAMAAAAVVRKFLDGKPPKPGARAADKELELGDFAELFAQKEISSMMLADVPEDRNRPVYRRILESRYGHLAAPIRLLHDVTGIHRFRGRSKVERGSNPFADLVATIMGFPKAGQDLAVDVELSVEDRVETWLRKFDGKPFSSTQEFGVGRYEGLVVERFGPMAFGLALVEKDTELHLMMRRWDMFGLAMPLFLAPKITAFEHGARDRFNFSIRLSLPLIGLIVAYRGWLEPAKQAGKA